MVLISLSEGGYAEVNMKRTQDLLFCVSGLPVAVTLPLLAMPGLDF